jgi:hypothetical protein
MYAQDDGRARKPAVLCVKRSIAAIDTCTRTGQDAASCCSRVELELPLRVRRGAHVKLSLELHLRPALHLRDPLDLALFHPVLAPHHLGAAGGDLLALLGLSEVSRLLEHDSDPFVVARDRDTVPHEHPREIEAVGVLDGGGDDVADGPRRLGEGAAFELRGLSRASEGEADGRVRAECALERIVDVHILEGVRMRRREGCKQKKHT